MNIKMLKNIWSFFGYYVSLNRGLMVSIVIDCFILIWSIINYKEVFSSSSLMIIFIAVCFTFIWQSINLISHFFFFKRINPSEKELSTLYDQKTKRIIYSSIKTDDLKQYNRDNTLGIMENLEVNTILRDHDAYIRPVITPEKAELTRRYIKHYQNNLLVFLNHKWHKIQDRRGKFTNDKKLCMAGEFNVEEKTWRVCEGYYYNGYLTNTIYNSFIGGTAYPLYPPSNSLNTPIVPFQRSPFSDHIGVSTLLLTKDGYGVILQQASNAAQFAGKKMPTGSGSVDYADFREDEDFRATIIRAAERELTEETRIFENLPESDRVKLSTEVRSFYRDLERGGKPEFCCLTTIDARLADIEIYINPNQDELAEDIRIPHRIDNKEDWKKNVLPSASVSLKMCYRAAMEYLESD